MATPSTRAQAVTRRTYNRPLNESEDQFETWTQTVDRVIGHQKWLWERAKGGVLSNYETEELNDLRDLMLKRIATVSGRTLWLGGTTVGQTREASQFNCSGYEVQTIHDVVDGFWLLLQGAGVGFKPVPGTLNGFARPVHLDIRRSKKKIGDPKGQEGNSEEFFTNEAGERVYRITVGDSAMAWAKLPGKLLAVKARLDRIEVNFEEVRAAGIRLKGYGWISSGDETISVAVERIVDILNRRVGELLTAMDIHDIMTHLGTTLSSRRSAEISLMDRRDPEINEFIFAKKDFWLHGNEHRQQANNSIMFYSEPSQWDLRYIFDRIMEAGGSEPGFINAQTAIARAPWFKTVNPCAEILLGNRSFCNLVEVDWGKFDPLNYVEVVALQRAIYIAARANYRQTCVNLVDGVLQRSWHELNEFLRLCGVGGTGIVPFLDKLSPGMQHPARVLQGLRRAAIDGAHSMADDLGMPRPKAVTTIKPSGTLSKIMDTTEGLHRPLGRYIFNWITFSRHEPLVPILRDAGYRMMDKPGEADSILVCFPVSYEDVKFTEEERDGETLYLNRESAIEQLERYKLLMENYVDHNASITVYYDPEEVPEIVNWIKRNWHSYVGVSFLYRSDPSKTAKDLGYLYLPQEVVTKSTFDEYNNTLKEVSFGNEGTSDLPLDDDCAGGMCPIR